MTEIALIFLINAVSSLLKKWVYPKFGKIGVQVVVFIAAVIGALYYTYGKGTQIEEIVAITIALFSSSVAIYEVILSNLKVFKIPNLKGRTN